MCEALKGERVLPPEGGHRGFFLLAISRGDPVGGVPSKINSQYCASSASTTASMDQHKSALRRNHHPPFTLTMLKPSCRSDYRIQATSTRASQLHPIYVEQSFTIPPPAITFPYNLLSWKCGQLLLNKRHPFFRMIASFRAG